MIPTDLFLMGRPTVWSRPRATIRGGKVAMYDPKTEDRKRVGLSLKEHFATPIEGPIKMEMTFSYATKDEKKWGQYKTSRGDLDNLVKFPLDALNKIAYADDSQVCVIMAVKKWDRSDYTKLRISRLNDSD